MALEPTRQLRSRARGVVGEGPKRIMVVGRRVESGYGRGRLDGIGEGGPAEAHGELAAGADADGDYVRGVGNNIWTEQWDADEIVAEEG